MKKILCIALVLAMVLATSCGNFQTKKNAVVEEEVIEVVDSTEVAVDSLQVVE